MVRTERTSAPSCHDRSRAAGPLGHFAVKWDLRSAAFGLDRAGLLPDGEVTLGQGVRLAKHRWRAAGGQQDLQLLIRPAGACVEPPYGIEP
jgi:hypothetical protein